MRLIGATYNWDAPPLVPAGTLPGDLQLAMLFTSPLLNLDTIAQPQFPDGWTELSGFTGLLPLTDLFGAWTVAARHTSGDPLKDRIPDTGFFFGGTMATYRTAGSPQVNTGYWTGTVTSGSTVALPAMTVGSPLTVISTFAVLGLTQATAGPGFFMDAQTPGTPDFNNVGFVWQHSSIELGSVAPSIGCSYQGSATTVWGQAVALVGMAAGGLTMLV